MHTLQGVPGVGLGYAHMGGRTASARSAVGLRYAHRRSASTRSAAGCRYAHTGSRRASACSVASPEGSSEGTAAVMVNCGQLNLAAYSSDACTGDTLADLSSAKRANDCNDEDVEGANTFSDFHLQFWPRT